MIFDANGKPWLLEANLDPSLSIEDLRGTPAGANSRLKSKLLVEMLNILGIQPPPPDVMAAAHSAAELARANGAGEAKAEAVAAAAASAAAEYHRVASTRKLSPDEVKRATLHHVDAEARRARSTAWRRLLPSNLSSHYAQFIGTERRELNLLPYSPITE